jgi:glutamine---fructose-6-phosphate transaminase (isomerizing)
MERDTYTYDEIVSQPEAWKDALAVVERFRPQLETIFQVEYDQVLFTGCGSTYYLSLAAAALFQESTGKLARAIPGGELLLNPAVGVGQVAGSKAQDHKTLLIAVSRSGSTTETVRAVEQFKRHNNGPVIAITNYGDQPLAGLADVALVIEKGQEESVAQTRSFASMYVAAAAMGLLAGKRAEAYQAMYHLPEAGAKLIAGYAGLAKQYGAKLDFDRVYFLGSGFLYGLACEVNLKMKEMTLTHSEPFHFLEFRHGPMSMVTETALIVGLVSERNSRHELAVLKEMQALGGHVLALGESGLDVNFNSGIPEIGRGVLYLPVLQLMAYYRSKAKGLNPDRPANLTAVVELDL